MFSYSAGLLSVTEDSTTTREELRPLFEETPVARPATPRQVKLESVGPQTFKQYTCVTLKGNVQQERARNTRSPMGLRHGFRKLVWKEVGLKLFGAHLELVKVEYSKRSIDTAKRDSAPLVLAKLPLKEVQSLGSIDDMRGGWRVVMMGGTLVLQLRATDDGEAERWMMAVAHNAAVGGVSVERQDAKYSSTRAWDYAEYSQKYYYNALAEHKQLGVF